MWTCRRWSRWSITRWREDEADAMSPPVYCPWRPSTLGAKEDGGGREGPSARWKDSASSTSANRPDRPNANLHVVFRLELVSGEPRGDGVGTLDAASSPWPNSRRRVACRRCRCGQSSSPLTGSCSRRSWTTSTINIASPICCRLRPVRAERCQPLGRRRVG